MSSNQKPLHMKWWLHSVSHKPDIPIEKMKGKNEFLESIQWHKLPFYRLTMISITRNLSKYSVALIAISLVLAGEKSLANTSAYVTSGLMPVSVDKCIKEIKEKFNDAGFTEQTPPSYSPNKRNAWIYANKPGTPYQAAGECSSETGTWGIGMSGINDEETFSEFRNMMAK